ncbi:PstS family phosphate ABC transporter substrate-binding protein [Natranaeroarchaeum sulfidigenes]
MASHRESGERTRGSSRRGFLFAAGSVGLAGLSGCITRGEESDLTGEIIVDGSNTVLPHTAAVAEEFQWRNNRVRIPVRGSGTGAGFQQFIAGETALQNASRRITDEERADAEANGIEFLELEAVLDGIAIMAHPDGPVDRLTVDQLHRLWRQDSDVERWSDLDSEWPDREISLYGRDSASGTYDYFTEAINDEPGNIRRDYNETADTNVIVRGVSGNRDALGFGGAGYFYENEDDLKLIEVDDDNGGVIPTDETVARAFEDDPDGPAYTPLSRSMYIYVNVNDLERDVVREFARFFFRREDPDSPAWTQRVAPRVKFYPIPDSLVERESDRLEAKIEEVR